MEKIIDKVSNYHIFNYIVPGVLFLLLCKNYLYINLNEEKLIYFFFVAYFVGIIISRISSLITEKIIYFIFKIKKETYEDYIKSSKKDEKIEILMQDGNMYRNLCTMLLIAVIIKIIKLFKLHLLINREITIILTFLLLISIFVSSYIKQIKYIISRIKAKK